MNPQDITMECRMWHELTDTERRKRDVKCHLAVNRLEGMEHHIPPRKGEHCYFNSSRPAHHHLMGDMIPAARYICVTNKSGTIGVDFSVETPVDTYYTHYHYQGKLERIKHDHGMGPLWRQRLS